MTAVVIAITPTYDLAPYPVAASRWLHEHGYLGRGHERDARVLSLDYFGNYLEWRDGDEASAWLDDRVEVHDPDDIVDHVLLISDKGSRVALLGRHPHDLIMWDVHSGLARWLETSPRYRVLYRDDVAIIACRVASSACPVP
ncbi:MAG: hypothetical protein R2698_09925 [Microthrixaceae bacterium]